jgi:hypothetical protein
MFRSWTRILPFFILRYIAIKQGERFIDPVTKKVFVQLYDDTIVYVKE